MTISDRALPAFLEADGRASYEEAHAVVLPVPYEATVSYGAGTASGPEAILRASEQLELYDEQLRDEPFRWGIWTAPPLAPDPRPGLAEEDVARRFGELLDAGKWVVMLGGEHAITPGGVRAAAARHPGLRVVQIDAHADLRASYAGRTDSHACAMRRCLDHAPVTALGIRSYSRPEADAIARGIEGYRLVHAWEMGQPGWSEPVIEEIRDRPVYLTIDVDGFDPSVIPATGTPEPGGLSWAQGLELLERVFGASRVVGCDVVELAPAKGQHHADFAVARLVYKLIGFASRAARGTA